MNANSMLPQPADAIESAEQQLTEARAGNDSLALVTAVMRLGEANLSAGATGPALTLFQEAMGLAQQQQLTDVMLQCWGAVGRALYHDRNYRAAHTAFQRTLQLAMQQKNFPLASEALLHMGLIEADAGDAANALGTLDHALAQAKAQQDLGRVVTAANRIGQLLLVTNEPAKAMNYFNQALAGAKQLNNSQGEMQARLGLARAHKQDGDGDGDPAQAAGEFEQALVLAEAQDETSTFVAVLGEVMRFRMAAGQRDQAVSESDAVLARAALRGDPQTEAALLLEVGTVWLEQGEPERALGYLQRATPLWQYQEEGPAYVSLQSAIGMAQFQLGAFDAAYTAYSEALALAERLEIVEARAVLHGRLSSILAERQETTAALEQAERSVALADTLQMPALQGELYMVLAFALSDLDRQAEAIAYAQRAHALLVEQKNEPLALQVEAILAQWNADDQPG